MSDRGFWGGRWVLLAAHTGFRGAGLALRLHDRGAQVTAYALAARSPVRASRRRPVETHGVTVMGWGPEAKSGADTGVHPHETPTLEPDCARSRELLGRRPSGEFEQAAAETVAWTRAWQAAGDPRQICRERIARHAAAAARPRAA